LVAKSVIFIDLSSDAVKRSLPSGLNFTEVIVPKRNDSKKEYEKMFTFMNITEFMAFCFMSKIPDFGKFC